MKYGKLFIFVIVLLLMGCSNTQTKQENQPNKEETYSIIRGINFSADGKYELALEQFNNAYKINKRNAFTNRSLGIIYCRLGDFEKGEQFFNESLKIVSNDVDTIYNLATLYHNQKKYEKAINLVNTLPLERQNPKLIKAKAFSYYELGDYKKSYSELNSIINLPNLEFVIYPSYVTLLKKMDMEDKIYTFIFNLYSKNRGTLDFVFLFVDYLIEINAYDNAYSILKEYGDNFEYSNGVVYKIAEVLYYKKDFAKAEQYLLTIQDSAALSENILTLKVKILRALEKNGEADSIEKILNKIKRVEKNEK